MSLEVSGEERRRRRRGQVEEIERTGGHPAAGDEKRIGRGAEGSGR